MLDEQPETGGLFFIQQIIKVFNGNKVPDPSFNPGGARGIQFDALFERVPVLVFEVLQEQSHQERSLQVVSFWVRQFHKHRHKLLPLFMQTSIQKQFEDDLYLGHVIKCNNKWLSGGHSELDRNIRIPSMV